MQAELIRLTALVVDIVVVIVGESRVCVKEAAAAAAAGFTMRSLDGG